jgi:hypothetical protein
MITLNEEQCKQLHSAEPLAIDPATRQTYVLVRREAYERLKQLLCLDDYDPDEAMSAMNEVMAEDDANDPLPAQTRARAVDEFLALAKSSRFRSHEAYPTRDELHERD